MLLPKIITLLLVLHCSVAPPVSPDKAKDSEIKDDLEEYMEYHRYLREVVQALESDPDFREKLEKADEEDVRSGKIAEQLDFVNHNVRTKLDEIKRREMERLRHLATKQFELTNNLELDVSKIPSNEHLDHFNPHTFEIEDLKKLIHKTTNDLDEADKKRKENFKEYEMQKEFERNQKMEAMDEAQKKEYKAKLEEEEKNKKNHKPLHHPGSKHQLEEVWEKQDHMDQQFDPKVFFMMHDVDGNGVWDADEVKALFIKELDKMYGPGGPNKDLHERAEEMERMREHVFQESDTNRDGLIDYNEFMHQTKKAEFQRDENWRGIDENQIYSPDEYQEFERRRLEELHYLQQRGLVDAHGRPIPGAHHQIQQALQQKAHHQQQQQYHQGQMPVHMPVPGQQMQGQQQFMPGQVPQFQGQPVQYQAPQPGYNNQNQQYQGQMPVQGQMPNVQGQIPNVQGQMPNVQGQMPNVQGQIPNVQGQMPNVQGQMPNIQAQAPAQGQAPPAQPQQIVPVQSQGQPAGQAAPSQGQAPSVGQGH